MFDPRPRKPVRELTQLRARARPTPRSPGAPSGAPAWSPSPTPRADPTSSYGRVSTGRCDVVPREDAGSVLIGHHAVRHGPGYSFAAFAPAGQPAQEGLP